MMGQRRSQSPGETTPWEVRTFVTPLGYLGLLGRNGKIVRLTLGQPSASAARTAVTTNLDAEPIPAGAWIDPVQNLLKRYACGERVDLAKIPVELPPATEFQEKVRKATVRIPYGRTVTYGELATLAGSPRAARAVGTVMSSNPLPLLVPCHRVVGSNGGLGGYSAPQGLDLKRQLLALEQVG